MQLVLRHGISILLPLLLLLVLGGAGKVDDACGASSADILTGINVLAAAKTVSPLHTDGTKYIIVTISDWMYRPLLLNWMVHMRYLTISEYLVICLDQQTLNLTGHWSDGGHGILVPECHERLEIFRFRHVMVHALLRADYVVILVDSDCVWLQNALSWILPLQGSVDMVAQMGFSPNRTFYKRGVTACAGFLTLMPTARTQHFYKIYLEGLLPGVDDQWHLNKLLEHHHAFSFESNETSYFHSQKEVIISKPPPSVFSITLGLLPYRKFPRMNDLRVHKEDDPFVWHNTKNWSAPRSEGPKMNRARDKVWLIDGKLVNITWINVSTNKVVMRKAAMKKAGVFALANTPWINLRSHNELDDFFNCIDVEKLRNFRQDKIYVNSPRVTHSLNDAINFLPNNSFSVWCKM